MNEVERYGQGATRTLSRALRIVLACGIALVCSRAANGQVFELTGGSSSLLNAEGGSLEIHAPTYRGRIDLGYIGRPSLGFYFSRPFKNWLLGAGDQQIPFLLPTDLFDHSYYFIGRGISFSRNVTAGKLFIFAGTTSNEYSAPFLNITRNDTPAGAIFYERQLSPSLRFFSHNIISKRQTSIQAIEWSARNDIKMALSAGLGNNQPFWSTSFTLARQWMSLDATYSVSGTNFRRVLVATPLLTENDRENIRFELRPLKNVRIVVSRNNYLSSVDPTLVERAVVQGFGVSGNVGGFQLNGSLFQSATKLGNASAVALGARRMITRHFEAGADLLRSGSSKTAPTHSLVGNVREILNSRFSLTQIITRSSGQTNIAFGGNFISNLVSVSVDYETVFLPFVQNAPGQFKQVMVLGLHFQLPHGMQFNMDTNVTPLGQMRYTAYASTYAYRGMRPSSSGTSFSGAFFQNIVRGEVLDPDGEPIAGAALQIGAELAVSDSDGNFMLRVKKAGDLNLKVAFEEFTAPGRYAIVQAPQTVKATREESAQEYSIVLRRLPNGVSSADPSHQPDLPDHPPGEK
jgi:hypothetical protein